MIQRSSTHSIVVYSSLLEASIKRQAGVALLISLMFLIIISLVSIAGLQNVALQEKMTTGSYDRNIALQAAEATLRFAEGIVNEATPSGANAASPSDDNCPDSSTNACTNGICEIPDVDCDPRWENPNFNSWVNIDKEDIDLGNLSGNDPQYFIEYLGNNFDCSALGSSVPKNCRHYRINVRGNPGTERSTVILQVVYVVE